MIGEVGLEEWLDAVALGDGYYYRCPKGHATLPPRDCCPECGGGLERRPLPSRGELRSYTVSNVSTPEYDDHTPLGIGIATFGPVDVTGRLPAAESGTLETGTTVRLAVEERPSDGSRVPVFRIDR
ncbi:Zn-ribbon domain-containing OB-fold protein [Natrarchaeobius oligotrophus]|uniref:Nucleic acid-binding protein n=1 Tax=Natrarchaeobius chitinivorans TaxID=1679083 RepID=A0A3N6NJV8_NATCH|nr:nucleic acid-binding protein [Natrarchaeobius chitinivorans]RQG99432.1 nucleic acid-binding protein [Natrarchaeobius chitinivorans]